MHQEQRDFLAGVDGRLKGLKVLEFGSLDINGSARDVYPKAAEWVGVDWRDGPAVDEVSLAHEWSGDKDFDAFVTGEMLEHDPYWRDSLANGVAHIKPDGIVVITCAGPGRKSHRPDCAPKGHYENLAPAVLESALKEFCVEIKVISGRDGKDVYATARKRKAVPHKVTKSKRWTR